jgi:hypothetical protein
MKPHEYTKVIYRIFRAILSQVILINWINRALLTDIPFALNITGYHR